MVERRESSGTLDSIHWRVTVECEEEKGREEVRTGYGMTSYAQGLRLTLSSMK